MHCSEVRKMMAAYLDEELDSATFGGLTHHIKQCANCEEYLHDLQKVDMLIRGLPRFDMRPDFAKELTAKVKQWGDLNKEPQRSESILASVLHLLENLLDVFERNKTPNTRTLDEFGDFPPLLMSSIYFKLMDT